MIQSRPTDAPAGTTPSRVLVIDDEPAITDLLGTALRYMGFEVRTAGTGMAGLEAARDNAPDLVVLDVMLPDIDGFEVCRRLRESGDFVPGDLPHRPRRRGRPGPRLHPRRRRLRDQAVLAPGADAAHRRAAPPHRRRRARRPPPLPRPGDGRGPPPGLAGRHGRSSCRPPSSGSCATSCSTPSASCRSSRSSTTSGSTTSTARRTSSRRTSATSGARSTRSSRGSSRPFAASATSCAPTPEPSLPWRYAPHRLVLSLGSARPGARRHGALIVRTTRSNLIDQIDTQLETTDVRDLARPGGPHGPDVTGSRLALVFFDDEARSSAASRLGLAGAADPCPIPDGRDDRLAVARTARWSMASPPTAASTTGCWSSAWWSARPTSSSTSSWPRPRRASTSRSRRSSGICCSSVGWCSRWRSSPPAGS